MNKLDAIYEVIQDMRQHFGWDKTDTIDYLKSAILEEAHELQQAETKQDLLYELADVLMLTFTLAKELNTDILELITQKAEIVKKRHYD